MLMFSLLACGNTVYFGGGAVTVTFSGPEGDASVEVQGFDAAGLSAATDEVDLCDGSDDCAHGYFSDYFDRFNVVVTTTDVPVATPTGCASGATLLRVTLSDTVDPGPEPDEDNVDIEATWEDDGTELYDYWTAYGDGPVDGKGERSGAVTLPLDWYADCTPAYDEVTVSWAFERQRRTDEATGI